MQKGFATLEIIFVVLIISILTAVAVPRAKNFVEKATLDYEQKRLYSELKFLQTFNRSAAVSDTGMDGTFTVGSTRAVMHFYNGQSYEILRTDKPIRDEHKLSNGVNFSLDNTGSFRIQCDNDGKYQINGKNPFSSSNVLEKTVVLKPKNHRYGSYVPTIVFDSVGRIRGGREKR